MQLSTSIRSQHGFTLIEILLVVIIIVALSSMVAPRLVGQSEKAKIAVAKSDIRANIATALKMYELDNGHFPTTRQGLMALRKEPTVSPTPKSWSGPYLEKEPVDPWGNAYMYVSPGKHNTDYDVYSKGPDDMSEEDDIKNWE